MGLPAIMLSTIMMGQEKDGSITVTLQGQSQLKQQPDPPSG